MTLDLTQYTKDKVKVVPPTMQAVLVSVEQKTAEDIFGKAAFDPMKIYLRLFVENAEHAVKITQDYAFYDLTELNNTSNLGKFISKYGSLACPQEVTIIKNKSGFFEVALQ